MEIDQMRMLETAARDVSEAISRLEKICASLSTDWSVHGMAQPIRELTDAIRTVFQPSQTSGERTPNAGPVKDGLWRTKDLAAYLGTSALAAMKLADRRGIPHMRLGRHRLFDPIIVKRWLASKSK